MAHAALLNLTQLLEEELIQFPCRVLKIEVEKVRAFHFKRKKFLHNLDQPKILTHVPHSYVVDLRKELEPLALAIDEDLMDAARSPKVLADSRPVLVKIPHILLLLEATKSGLKDFVHSLDGEVISHPADSLSIQRELATYLLASAEEFTKVIRFFNLVAEEAKIHYNSGRRLLGKLKHSNHDVVNRIKTAADEAGDCIEEFLTMSTGDQFWWQKKDFMNDKSVHDLLEHIGQLLYRAANSNIQVENEDYNTSTFVDSQPESSQIPRPWERRTETLLPNLFSLPWESSSETLLPNLYSTDEIAEQIIQITDNHGYGHDEETTVTYAGRGFSVTVESSESASEVEDFGMAVDDDVSNMIEELTGLLTIVETSHKAGTNSTFADSTLRRIRLGRGFFVPVESSESASEVEDFGMAVDDDVSNMIDELTGPPSGLTILETSHKAGTNSTFADSQPESSQIPRPWERRTETPLPNLFSLPWKSSSETLLPNLYSPDEIAEKIIQMTDNHGYGRDPGESSESGGGSERSFSVPVESSESPSEVEDFGMAVDDDVSNMIDELTGPPSGLTIVETSHKAGTTTNSVLAKVFHRVVDHFDCRAWVNGISSTDQMLLRIFFTLGPSGKELHADDVGELLYKRLRGSKYLVVLDGLQNFEVWDSIRRYFPDDNVGSRVVLNYVLKVESAREWSLKQEDIALGLNDYLSKIIVELTRPPSGLSIVTIAGMGGIGKTTLAKKTFHHEQIVHYFHLLAWVNSVSSTDQVLSHLLQDIVPSREEVKGQSTEDKGVMLYRSLKGRKYLIVVDGLWNFETWDAVQIYLPDDKVGSRILITTRATEFPTTCNIPKNPPHCMTPLNRHQSWELLEKLVFGRESCPPGLVAVGQEIAERCGGLPLAIVVIAGILRSIPKEFCFWRSIMDDVTSIVSADPEGCLNILALSYRKLPNHLQDCFRYMGAFPANCEIEVEYLLNLWIANGFLNCESRSHSETMAERYLNDLIVRSLVSVGKRRLDGKPRTCLVHNLVRQLCLREAQKEDFMYVVEEGANAQDLEKQSHLIFNLENLDDFELLPPLPRLRSFIWLYFGSDFTPGMVHLQLSVFKRLRVVDIYYLLFDSFPSQLLNLVILRYLALQVTYELDASISQLLKLQTLVINGPWFLGEGEANPTLYLKFWKMPWLRNVYVKIPSCLRYPQPLLDYPWEGSNIQSFSMMTLSSCTMEVLWLMRHLKKLGVSETKEDFQKGESAKCFGIFSFLFELETLKCYFYKGNREARSLDLAVLPGNLKRLSLKGSCLSWDRMKFLALLPKLETLKLKDYAFQGPEWVLTEEVFRSLKQLLIDNTDLVNWEAESTDHFPCLKRLVLRSCRWLEKIPCGVGELSVLELIELRNCSESVEDSAREFREQYEGLKVDVTRSDGKRVVEKGGQSSEYEY